MTWIPTSFAPTTLVFLFLAAASPAIAAVEPCALLTIEQVSTTMGVSMAAKSPTPKGCVWDETGKSTGKRVFVNILSTTGFTTGRTPLTGTEKPSIAGVGDEAYYKYFTQPRYDKIKVVDLDFKKGDVVIGIEVWGLPTEDAKAKAKTLALLAVGKL
jgi:hypothetical protein